MQNSNCLDWYSNSGPWPSGVAPPVSAYSFLPWVWDPFDLSFVSNGEDTFIGGGARVAEMFNIGVGCTSNQTLLEEAKSRVALDLRKPKCAKDFKDIGRTLSAIQDARLRPLNKKYEGMEYSHGLSILTGTRIALNSRINRANPEDLLAAESARKHVPVTASQNMDLALIHEVAHYQGKVGNPDEEVVELKLWKDCIE
jgi:hypothetical protein